MARSAGGVAVTVLLALVLLAGCSAQLGDRGGTEGAAPDRISDVDFIEVFRNADNFPNMARMCVDGLAFASSSSGGPSLVRVPEWDGWCAVVTRGGTPAPPTPTPTASPPRVTPTG
jgi:hypothetical protein